MTRLQADITQGKNKKLKIKNKKYNGIYNIRIVTSNSKKKKQQYINIIE